MDKKRHPSDRVPMEKMKKMFRLLVRKVYNETVARDNKTLALARVKIMMEFEMMRA